MWGTYGSPTWGPTDPGRAPTAHMTPPFGSGNIFVGCHKELILYDKRREPTKRF
jgi:hypothetical protein